MTKSLDACLDAEGAVEPLLEATFGQGVSQNAALKASIATTLRRLVEHGVAPCVEAAQQAQWKGNDWAPQGAASGEQRRILEGLA